LDVNAGRVHAPRAFTTFAANARRTSSNDSADDSAPSAGKLSLTERTSSSTTPALRANASSIASL
jgi:hypothetical protein